MSTSRPAPGVIGCNAPRSYNRARAGIAGPSTPWRAMMAKKKDAKAKVRKEAPKPAPKAAKDDGKLGNKEYAKELKKLHVELVKMQAEKDD